MSRVKSWVLTDTFADIWQDTFAVNQSSFPQKFPAPWSVQKRTLRGGRRDGVEVVEVNNGVLSFTVLPTRGMGIWSGWYRGSHLGWQAPVLGPVHPLHVNLLDRGGLGWLDGFDEWICRCGLSSNGPPCTDPVTGEFLPLHGRIANLPAHYLEVQVNLAEPHELKVVGQVDETTMFFSRLRMTTTLTTTPGSNRILIEDKVENLSSRPAELELLYHCNFGPPFVEAGSKVLLPFRQVAPRDLAAAEGVTDLHTVAGPTPGFKEQVFYFDPLADREGWTVALLHNARADRGVAVRFKRAELPHFIVWKNSAAAEDGYVVGLEPATDLPNPRPFEREKGRVVTLPPEGSYYCTVAVEIHDTALTLETVLDEIARLQKQAKPVIHPKPVADLSPAGNGS
jgi:hypothetical protein